MKKTNLLFSTILILLKLNSNGQAIYDWALKYGGSIVPAVAPDEARVVKTDNSGNVYTAGSFYGTADFDPGPGTQTMTSGGSGDGYIAKYDASGNFLAVYTFSNVLDCKIYSIDIDNAGNIVATGNFEGTVDFDPGAGSYTLNTTSNFDFFVLKLNASGTFAWAVKFGVSGVPEYGYGIDADFNNDILVTGSFYGTTDFNPGVGINNLVATAGGDAFVLKLTAAGAYVWAFNIGNGTNSIDCGNSIRSDATGNVFVGGYFQGICDFDPSVTNYTLATTSVQSGFLAKYSVLGNFIWAKQFDGTGISNVTDLNLDASSNVYSVGSFTGTVDADPGIGTTTIASVNTQNDIFIVRMDGLGNFNWANKVGGTGDDFPSSITADASGVYYGGYFTGNVDFDPGISTHTILSTGAKDFFISKVDLNGNHLFSYGGGNSGGDDKTFGIVTPSTNVIYVAGRFYGTVDFNPNPLVNNNLTSTGGYDAFLLKLKPCTETLSLAPTTTICSGSSATLTVSGSNTYTWNTGATNSVIVVTPTINTTYSVTGSFTSGCVDTKTTDVQLIICVGLKENTYSSDVSIYPNPTTGKLFIETGGPSSLTIINVLGQTISESKLQSGSNTIDLNELASGIYYFTIKQGYSVTTKKIVKQ